MELYKYETHCHTYEGSACAESCAKDMVRKYKELGYTGIVVTDHFFNGNCRVNKEYPQDLPWEEKVDLYFKGYENAKEEGDKIGLQVFPGIEWSFHGTDIITYGLTKEWIKDHPEIVNMELDEYAKLAHKAGAVLIHAHPFREAHYIHMFRLIPQLVDAIEVYNTSHDDETINYRANFIADSYKLVKTSGSDAHNIGDISEGGIAFDHKLKSLEEMMTLIKQNKITKI